jgi:hypothetical protein
MGWAALLGLYHSKDNLRYNFTISMMKQNVFFHYCEYSWAGIHGISLSLCGSDFLKFFIFVASFPNCSLKGPRNIIMEMERDRDRKTIPKFLRAYTVKKV